MNDTAPPRASVEEREQEVSELTGRLAGALSLSDLKMFRAFNGVIVSAGVLAEEPFEHDTLRLRQLRADRALDRLRQAVKALEQ